MITARDLLESLKAIPEDRLDLPVQVWLPGSYISLEGEPFYGNGNPAGSSRISALLIEGNLIKGSALCRT